MALTTTQHLPALGTATWASLLGSALLVACGGGGGDSSAVPTLASGYPQAPVSCSTTDQKAWLRDYMNDRYFWYDQQGTPNDAATTPAGYLSSLLFKPKDRYSYTQNTAQYTQFFAEGTRTGYGYALMYEDAAKTVLKVRLIEPRSPLGTQGLLQRGDTIVSIDGFTPAQITAGQLSAVSTEGVQRNFVVQGSTGQRSFSALSATFPLSPVIDARVLTVGSTRVGYLMYQEFITTGAAALGSAFEAFSAAGVTELILDFRYNGGGSTAQARNIASMAGGAAVEGKVFANYRYSAKLADNNVVQNFTTNGLPAVPLAAVNRVFVITSGDTASASELVINALRPFKPVITIGGTTYGKPYAFVPQEACGTTSSAVNIEIANALGSADYSAGFAATCPVADDLTRQLGDPLEARLAAALGYVRTGSCPVAASVLQPNKPNAQGNAAQAATKSIVSSALQSDTGYGEISPAQMRMD